MISYLVTGGSGYLGSRLVKHLINRGDRVVFLYRSKPQIDLLASYGKQIVPLAAASTAHTDYRAAIQNNDVEAIFHLASKVSYSCQESEVAEMVEANVTLGSQLMEAMSSTSCHRFVNAATYWQHFDGHDYNPICLYAATKQAFMDIVTYYTNWRGISCISLKLTDIYGENDPRPKIFSLINKAAETEQTLKLTKGEQLVSFLHVDDAVTALCKAAELTKNFEGVHKSYGTNTDLVTLRSAVELYIRTKGKRPRIEWGGSLYSKTQIMKPWVGESLPNWQPTVTLEEGFRRM
jgi:nucleoside-diphosphate-sugar epimerase